MKLATVALVSLMPWSSSAAPAHTERRGCRAGYSFNLTSELCELCPSDTFTDSYNWENRCQPCTPCGEGRKTVSACNASSNTVCRCADDHYEHEDGCSPRTGTTRSSIEELNPILQGIKKQIGMEAQKGQEKIDNLTKEVDFLHKLIVSGAYAEQAMTDKMQIQIVALCVVVALLFLLVLATFIVQYYSKLVEFCRSQRGFGHEVTGAKDKKDKKRDQLLDGTKDQKDEKRNQPLDGSHASPRHGDGSTSSQQKVLCGRCGTTNEHHNGSATSNVPNDVSFTGASGGTDIELRRTSPGVLAVADDDDSPNTSKSEASRVDFTRKDMRRSRVQADVDLHGNQSDEENALIQSDQRN